MGVAFASGTERDLALYLFHWHYVQRYKHAADAVRFEGEPFNPKHFIVKAKAWQMPGERVRLAGWRWALRRAACGEQTQLGIGTSSVTHAGEKTFTAAVLLDPDEGEPSCR